MQCSKHLLLWVIFQLVVCGVKAMDRDSSEELKALFSNKLPIFCPHEETSPQCREWAGAERSEERLKQSQRIIFLKQNPLVFSHVLMGYHKREKPSKEPLKLRSEKVSPYVAVLLAKLEEDSKTHSNLHLSELKELLVARVFFTHFAQPESSAGQGLIYATNLLRAGTFSADSFLEKGNAELLARVEYTLKKAGCTKVSLTCVRRETQEFYRQRGYAQDSTSKYYVKNLIEQACQVSQ